jgi:hypothetical protein
LFSCICIDDNYLVLLEKRLHIANVLHIDSVAHRISTLLCQSYGAVALQSAFVFSYLLPLALSSVIGKILTHKKRSPPATIIVIIYADHTSFPVGVRGYSFGYLLTLSRNVFYHNCLHSEFSI